VKKLQHDVVNLINPLARKPDRWIFWPIYPRDETSVEGMMMVMIHLLEQFALIEEIDKDGEPTGNHRLHENARE